MELPTGYHHCEATLRHMWNQSWNMLKELWWICCINYSMVKCYPLDRHNNEILNNEIVYDQLTQNISVSQNKDSYLERLEKQ